MPAVLMVSTIRFRSFKTFDLRMRRPYTILLFFAAGVALIATHPRIVLAVIAYTYLASAFIGLAISKFRHRDGQPAESQPAQGSAEDITSSPEDVKSAASR